MDLRLPTTIVALPLALALGAASTPSRPSLPTSSRAAEDSVVGWVTSFRGGAAVLSRDTVEKHGGGASAHLATDPAKAAVLVNSGGGGGHGGGGGGGGGGGPRVMPIYLAQTLNARPYRDRRVRLSMWVRTRLPEKPTPKMPVSKVNVFMRIENEDGTFVLWDGNASPIFGSTEWSRRVVVLEVPADAYAITFGLAATGPGEMWIDDVVLEDQGQASGQAQKIPMMPPERAAQMSPEQMEQAKQRLATTVARSAERPTEVTNGDFETR